MTTTARIPYEVKSGMVNHIELSGWLIGRPRICLTKNGKEYVRATLNLGKPGAKIGVKLWINPSTNRKLIEEALAHKDGDEDIVTGSLDIWKYKGIYFVSLNAERIE